MIFSNISQRRGRKITGTGKWDYPSDQVRLFGKVVYGYLFNDVDFNRHQADFLESALNSVRKSLENSVESIKHETSKNVTDCFYLVGDAGLEPTAFGSGDQRSIHLS